MKINKMMVIGLCALMILSTLIFTNRNSTASTAKVDDFQGYYPTNDKLEFGKTYTVVPPYLLGYIHLYTGDNLTLNITNITNGFVGFRFSNGDPQSTLFYSDTSNETNLNGGASWINSDYVFWFTMACEEIVYFDIDMVQSLPGAQADCTFYRTNSTSYNGPERISNVETNLSKINDTITNMSQQLNTNLSLLNDKITNNSLSINYLNENISTIFGDIADLNQSVLNNITQIQALIESLSSQYNSLSQNLLLLEQQIAALNQSGGINLTGIYTNLSDLSHKYSQLSDNLSRLNNTIYTYNNQTIYLYDNGTLSEIINNLTNDSKLINSLNDTLTSLNTQNDNNITGLLAQIDTLQRQFNTLQNKTSNDNGLVTKSEVQIDYLTLTIISIIILGIIAGTGLILSQRIKRLETGKNQVKKNEEE